MIRPLRTAHRWIWTLLALLLPVLLYAALSSRVEPVTDGIDAAAVNDAEDAAEDASGAAAGGAP